jgi:hypothetical protein
MRNIILILLISLPIGLLKADSGYLSDPVSEKSIFDLINYQDIIEVDIEMKFNELLRDKSNEDGFDAVFSFSDLNGEKQAWKTKVEIRGKFRRVHCEDMPPLRLNFKKGDLEEAGLAKFDDLKMVTQCVNDENEAKQLLLKEYLAYKIYNKITDRSFRVQFVKINFKDTETNESRLQYGFIIEDTAQLRARLNAEKYDNIFGIKREQLDENSYSNMVLFQYMIGNTDWSVLQTCKNVKVMSKGNKLIQVPYDFDFSKMVDADYAKIKLTNKPRLMNVEALTKMNENMDSFKESIELFRQKKAIINQMVKDSKLIKKSDRRKIIESINHFYQDINEENWAG